MIPLFKVTQEKNVQNSSENGSIFTKLILPILTANRLIISFFARAIVNMDITFTEGFFKHNIFNFIDLLNPIAVFTTHPFNIRAGRYLAVPSICHIPDPGYGPIQSQGLVEDVAGLAPFAGYSNSNIAYTLPSYAIQDILRGIYAIKEKTLITGTTNSTITPTELKEKWSQPIRTIIFSTNGNGTTIKYLSELVQDFIEQNLNNDDIKYRIVFFTGEHNDKKCKPILKVMKTLPEKYKGIITHVRTQNKWETALRKVELIKQAHAEVRSMGEQIIDIAMGCIPIATKTIPINECRNTKWAVSNKTGLAMAYKENYDFWRSLFHFDQDTIGFANKYNNLVDYFDYIFFSDKDIAKTIIDAGTKRTSSDANFYNIAFLLQLTEKISNFEDEMETSKQEILKYRS